MVVNRMKVKMYIVVRTVLGILVLGIFSQTTLVSTSRSDSLFSDKILSLIQSEISGEQIKDHLMSIAAYHRISASPGYSEAAQYILEQLQQTGFSPQEAWIEKFRSGGQIQYQTWPSPYNWHIESAQLNLVKPNEEIFVHYPHTTTGLITHSNSGSLKATVVDVGLGTSDSDYEGKELEGHFVLANGNPNDVHRLAVLKYGATALISYPDEVFSTKYPDSPRHSKFLPRYNEMDRISFGFNISAHQAQKIKTLLADGERVLFEAQVNGRGLENGTMDIVTAVIPGREHPDQELVFLAHLDQTKQTDGDGTGGAAVNLHIAHVLKNLITQEKLPRPKRSLRFLWVPKLQGTMAYIDAHPEMQGPERGGSVLASINLDIIPEQSGVSNSRIDITRTPRSISSALTDVVIHTAECTEVDSTLASTKTFFSHQSIPFRGHGDHIILNDGMIGVPTVMIGNRLSYNNESLVSEISPEPLERSALVASAALWYLADLSEMQSLKLTNLVAANGHRRLAIDVNRAANYLLKTPFEQLDAMYDEGKRLVSFAVDKEIRTLESVLSFVQPNQSTSRLVRTWIETLQNQAQMSIQVLRDMLQQRGGTLSFSPQLTPQERTASKLIPSRITRGPLAPGLPQSRLIFQEQSWYETSEVKNLDRYLLLNFVDGNRSILDLRNILSAATKPVSLETVDHFIRDLAKLRLVELRKTP